jgi:hypothetical protein
MRRGAVQMIGGVALQQPDGEGAVAIAVAHAIALAKNFRRADAGATATHDVLFQDGHGGARKIGGGDGADKAGDIDARGTGGDTGRLITEVTTIGLGQRAGFIEGHMHIGEIFGQDRPALTSGLNIHPIGHWFPAHVFRER